MVHCLVRLLRALDHHHHTVRPCVPADRSIWGHAEALARFPSIVRESDQHLTEEDCSECGSRAWESGGRPGMGPNPASSAWYHGRSEGQVAWCSREAETVPRSRSFNGYEGSQCVRHLIRRCRSLEDAARRFYYIISLWHERAINYGLCLISYSSKFSTCQ